MKDYAAYEILHKTGQYSLKWPKAFKNMTLMFISG